MFDERDRIRRTIKNLPDDAEAMTESDDPEIAGLLQQHVPAKEGQVGQGQEVKMGRNAARLRTL